MTLAEILPSVRQLTVHEKLRLIRLLAEELDSREDISPFEHDKVYYLPTPYNSFGSARILANALQASDESSG